MKFSQSTMGFYDPAINGADIPADAVDISAERHRDLLEAQALGHIIMADANGYPLAVPAPAPSLDELAALVRAERDRRLRDVDAVAGNILRWSELTDPEREAYAALRRALLDVPAQPGFPNDVVWPELADGQGH